MKLIKRLKAKKTGTITFTPEAAPAVTYADPGAMITFVEESIRKQLGMPKGTFEYTLEVAVDSPAVVRCAYYLKAIPAQDPFTVKHGTFKIT